MVWEQKVLIEDKSYIVVVADEIQALLAAKAAGRAVVGVAQGEDWDMKGIPYVVLSREDVTKELLELVLRRHLGLPWLINETERLMIREFVREDAGRIPEEEYGREEAVFRSGDLLALYIKNQYGFYEYGTWALVHKRSGRLIGMAGVSNPRLPADMERYLGELEQNSRNTEAEGNGAPISWLELGYHIFRPWRRQGYAREAVAAVMCYSHKVLEARLCALIPARNRPSCRLAESLKMQAVTKRSIAPHTFEKQILYVEPPFPGGS